MQAAILDIKLKHLDTYIDARRSVAAFYDQAFAGHPRVSTPVQAAYSHHVFHQYTIKITDTHDTTSVRDGLQEYLAGHSIPSMIYYPVPGHRQQMFAQFKADTVNLPITDRLTEQVISLPIHTEMEDDQLAFITDKVLSYLKN